MFTDMFHIQMQLMQRLDQWNEYVCAYVCMYVRILFENITVNCS